MSRFLCASFLIIALWQTGFAQVTVHVLNPWRNDSCAGHRDSMLVQGFNNGNGVFNSAWANRPMTPEGGNWFYFTFASRTNSFALVTYCGPATWQGWVSYKNGYNFNIDSLLMRFPTGTNELWITIGDSTQPPQFYDKPLTSKAIYIFNPWPNNSSQISIDDRTPMKMQARKDICGWYTCFYVGPVDSLYNVYFTDYFHTQKYTSSGLAAGPPIDLRAALETKDTVYILPKPFPYGPPGLYSTFPGQTGDCGLRKVSGIFRDWKLDNISFFNDPMGARSGGKGMVQTTLQPPDYKPQLTPAAAAANPPNPPVSTWYQTFTFPGGRQNDTCIDLTLKKSDDGTWTFNSDDMGGFFPLDSFNDPNNIKYSDHLNPTDPASLFHNYHFSMEMHLQFVYYQNAGLVFDFTGDDDLWIFVNNRLAVDLGGLNNRVSDTFDVDKRNISLGLGLINGQTYNMDIFYAERNPIGSNLIIQTTMDLENSANLYYIATTIGPGKTQYFILEHVQSDSKTCGFTPLFNQIDTPTVNFYIQGPQFLTPFQLQKGGQFNNGIIVDANNPRVTLDSAVLDTTLLPGDYHITFTSTTDPTRTGYLVFTVPPLPPNHLDILTDSTVMNPAKDAFIDSIFLAMDMPSTQAYAVLRDKNGTYFSNASAEKWTSRDTSVVTVALSPTDPSRCIITKKGTGSTWVVVSQAGMKPDSVRVSAISLPGYPIISSAVMLDANGDIIPDMLSITLNDTFHTDQKLDSVVIAYRGRLYGIPASKTVLSGTTLSVPFAGPGESDAGPSGEVTIFMDVNAALKSYSKAFTDGVGPAIVAADVMENDGSGPDTLFVTFSESLRPSSLTGKQLLLIKTGAIDTLSLTILEVIAQSNDSTFTLQVTSSGQQPKGGDRLRLLPGSRGGTIVDQSKNTPHDLNRSVVLGLRLGPPAIIASYYRDGNADGFIDTVVMAFKRPVQASEIQMMSVRWSWSVQSRHIDTVPLSTLKKLNDSTYCIPVHGETLTPKMVRTNVGMELLMNYTNFPDLPPRSAIVADSAAPVIDSVSLVHDQNCGNSDTLLVSFSEPVILSSSTSPLIVLDKTANTTRMPALSLLKVNGNSACFSVAADQAPQNGDLLWINPQNCVHDSGGAYQTNQENRKSAIAVASPKSDWRDPFVNINPFSPGSAIDAPDAPRGKGTFIAILPKCPNTTINISANIKIFDPLGNFIFENNQAVKYGNGYSIAWDGYNRSGRAAGTGVYRAVVTITGEDGTTSVYTLRVGVKR